jgi:hypothetical protein
MHNIFQPGVLICSISMANFCLGKATVPFRSLTLHVILQEGELY